MRVSIYEQCSKKTGKTSLIMITGSGSNRTKKALGLYYMTKPRTIEERKERDEKLKLARQLANEHERELLRGGYELPVQYRTQEDFFIYAWKYVEQLEGVLVETKKYKAMLRKFEAFLGRKKIACHEITPRLISQFVKYMESIHIGETARGYLSRLKIILKAATAELLFKTNPATDISARVIGKQIKAVFTLNEITLLKDTPLERPEVKDAFLFSTLTALRFCDIKNLTWANIKDNTLTLIQSKTSHQLVLPLIPEAMELLGKRKNDSEKVFNLCTHATTVKWLKIWCKRAGINKVLTFHVGRKSAATNLINKDVNIVTVSRILGHRNLSVTNGYVQISHELKEDALFNLSFSQNKK